MGKAVVAALAFWLAALTAWLVYDRARPAEPPFAHFCATAIDGVAQCTVSLAALAGDPRAADGRTIASRGLLALDRGQLALWASRSAFRVGDRRQALRVLAPADQRAELLEEFRGMVVVFRGRVDAAQVESLQLGFMGAISSLEHVAPAPLPDPDEGAEPDEGAARDASTK